MAVREGWNAHNDIGMALEMKARHILFPGVPYGADNTIFTADNIESGGFTEVMLCLLRVKYGYKNNDTVDGFIEKLGPIFGKSVHDIAPDFAQSLLDEFEKIMGE